VVFKDGTELGSRIAEVRGGSLFTSDADQGQQHQALDPRRERRLEAIVACRSTCSTTRASPPIWVIGNT